MKYLILLVLVSACAHVPEKNETQVSAASCTGEMGYSDGLNGINRTQYCASIGHSEYAEQRIIGHKVSLLRVERYEIQKQIDRSDDDKSTFANLGRGAAMWQGKSPTEALDNRRAELDRKISVIDGNAPGGPQVTDGMRELRLRQELIARLIPEDPRYFLDKVGAFAGTLFGFGVGHAIQGRYGRDGWQWTLGEIATLGIFSATADESCSGYVLDPATNISRMNCVANGRDQGTATAAKLLFLGTRIWQSYNLWTYEPNTKYQSSVILLPDGVAWTRDF